MLFIQLLCREMYHDLSHHNGIMECGECFPIISSYILKRVNNILNNYCLFFLNNNRKIDIDRKLLDNLNHRWMKIKFKIKSMIYSFASL